jgi:hypothetical protein
MSQQRSHMLSALLLTLLAIMFVVPERANVWALYAQDVPPWEIDRQTRQQLEAGRFHAAMRLLPDADRQWQAYTARTGRTEEGAGTLLHSRVMAAVAKTGDAEWGLILDDRTIPHRYKTEMLFEIVESRLGKGSVYLANTQTIVIPRNSPIDLRQMIQWPEP